MTDQRTEEKRMRELSQEAINLTEKEVAALQERVKVVPNDLELRFKLFYYFREQSFIDSNCTDQLFEHTAWLIERESAWYGWHGFSIASTYSRFSLRQVEWLLEKWMARIDNEPTNERLIGFAGYFIVSSNPKLGERLLKKALSLNPENSNWSFRLALHYYFLFLDSKGKRKVELAKKCIELFLKDLKTAPWINLENAANCALFVNDLEAAEFCGRQFIRQIKEPYFEHMGHAILAIVALRKGKKSESVKLLMMRGDRKFKPNQFSFQLIRELFEKGERDSIIEFIEGFERKLGKKYREKWIRQIQNDICPDF